MCERETLHQNIKSVQCPVVFGKMILASVGCQGRTYQSYSHTSGLGVY